MARTKLGSNATFTGGNKGATYIGDRLYAFSGGVGVAASAITVLDFMTEKGIIACEWRGVYVGSTNADYSWVLYLNGIAVEQMSATSKYENNVPRKLVIPPLTNVKITAVNIEDSSTNNVGAIIAGRTYDA